MTDHATADAEYLKANGVPPEKIRVQDGWCMVYDNPCGWPGACFGWWRFSSTMRKGCDEYVSRVYIGQFEPAYQRYLAALRAVREAKAECDAAEEEWHRVRQKLMEQKR